MKALLLDFGGVVLKYRVHVQRQLAAELGADPEALLDFYYGWKERLFTGKLKSADYAALVGKEFGVGDVLPTWKRIYLRTMVVNNELLGMLDRVRPSLTIAALSNSTDLHHEVNRERGITPRFSPGIFSHLVGFQKPDRRIYEAALGQLRLPPEECVFVDDKESNIPPAREMGFKTILFTNNYQFARELRSLGVRV